LPEEEATGRGYAWRDLTVPRMLQDTDCHNSSDVQRAGCYAALLGMLAVVYDLWWMLRSRAVHVDACWIMMHVGESCAAQLHLQGR
jgi:hypothetical protein